MRAAIALAVLALAPPAIAAPAPVHASADDCAVMVEVGRHALDWGAAPPTYDFFADTPIAGGGTYLADCQWTKLGLAAPTIGSPKSSKGFFFSRPTYDAARIHATLELQTSMRAEGVPPYLRVESCTVERAGVAWRFVSCTTTAIT